jgi:hypothetical protein
MFGHRPSHNLVQAGLPGFVLEGFHALHPAFRANGLGYTIITTTTTMRWHMPVALRGGGLD